MKKLFLTAGLMLFGTIAISAQANVKISSSQTADKTVKVQAQQTSETGFKVVPSTETSKASTGGVLSASGTEGLSVKPSPEGVKAGPNATISTEEGLKVESSNAATTTVKSRKK